LGVLDERTDSRGGLVVFQSGFGSILLDMRVKRIDGKEKQENFVLKFSEF